MAGNTRARHRAVINNAIGSEIRCTVAAFTRIRGRNMRWFCRRLTLYLGAIVATDATGLYCVVIKPPAQEGIKILVAVFTIVVALDMGRIFTLGRYTVVATETPAGYAGMIKMHRAPRRCTMAGITTGFSCNMLSGFARSLDAVMAILARTHDGGMFDTRRFPCRIQVAIITRVGRGNVGCRFLGGRNL